MKIKATALVWLASDALEGATGFLPVPQITLGRRAFGLRRMSTSEREVKTLNSTDLASNQLVNVLNDRSFKGPIHEAEKEVSGSVMFNMVGKLGREPMAHCCFPTCHCSVTNNDFNARHLLTLLQPSLLGT